MQRESDGCEGENFTSQLRRGAPAEKQQPANLVSTPFIPARTRAELAAPAAAGSRHAQAVAVACSLAGNGFVPDAIFTQLRATYPHGPGGMPDAELSGIARWACAQGFRPSGSSQAAARYPTGPSAPRRVAPVAVDPCQAAKGWLAGFTAEEVDLWEQSPLRPPDDWTLDAGALLAALYAPGELVNVVADFFLDAEGKPKPKGAGVTTSTGEWIESLAHRPPPSGAAGTWFRPNPILARSGSGKGGAFTDADVAAPRFLLLESDKLPLDVQLCAFAKLIADGVPFAALFTSGGRSVHGLLAVHAPDADAYRAGVQRIFARLAPLGFDAANANPSRLARLPGVMRHHGAADAEGTPQRLLYLNPTAGRGEILAPQ